MFKSALLKKAAPGVHVVEPPKSNQLGNPTPKITLQPTFDGISNWLRKNDFDEDDLPYAVQERADLLSFHKFYGGERHSARGYVEVSLKRPEGTYDPNKYEQEEDELMPVLPKMPNPEYGDVKEAYLRYEMVDKNGQMQENEHPMSYAGLAKWLQKYSHVFLD